MRLAFSTAIEPTWELSAVTARARDLGYDGIDVALGAAAAAGGGGDPAAGSPLAERDLVKLACEQAGVAIAGVSAPLAYAADPARDAATADAVRRVVDLAARVRAPHARVLDAAVPPRVDPAAAGLRYADWLLPLADHAAAAGVDLLVQNALSHRAARQLWRVIEQADHPALGAAWDPLAAALAGESFAVSVPTLNTRIRHALLRDATLAAGEAGGRRVAALARLGEGELSVRPFLDRLRGIGFDAWVTVAYPPPTTASAPAGKPAGLGTADELLADAAERVRGWLSPAKKPMTKAASLR